jgi:hypothetical protein
MADWNRVRFRSPYRIRVIQLRRRYEEPGSVGEELLCRLEFT